MELLPTFRMGFTNAWWLILPLVLPVAYVAATIMFLGICVVTMNLLLLAWLAVMCVPSTS